MRSSGCVNSNESLAGKETFVADLVRDRYHFDPVSVNDIPFLY